MGRKKKRSTIFLEKTRQGHRQQNQQLNCFKGNAGKHLSDGAERIWDFPNAQMTLSVTKLNQTCNIPSTILYTTRRQGSANAEIKYPLLRPQSYQTFLLFYPAWRRSEYSSARLACCQLLCCSGYVHFVFVPGLSALLLIAPLDSALRGQNAVIY